MPLGVLVTLPPPETITVKELVMGGITEKEAETFRLVDMATMHEPVSLQSPIQPSNCEPVPGD